MATYPNPNIPKYHTAKIGLFQNYLWLGLLIFILWSIYKPGFLDFINPVFAHKWALAAIGLFATYLALRLIRQEKANRIIQVGAGLSLVFILAVPWLLPVVYGSYVPHAEVRPNYEMVWLTPPLTDFDSAFKQAQRLTEKQGCVYTILGWGNQNELYYQSSCDNAVTRYQPVSAVKETIMSSLPPALSLVQRKEKNSYPPAPGAFTSQSRNYFIAYETALSPDKQWTAVAIRDFYGPSDIILIPRP